MPDGTHGRKGQNLFKRVPVQMEGITKMAKRVTEDKRDVRMIPLTHVHADFTNVRTDVKESHNPDGGTFADLKASIKRDGQRTPGVVRPHPTLGTGQFQVVCGHRRYQACAEGKVANYFAEVVDVNDADARTMQLQENIQRQDLTPAEVAMACANLHKSDKLSAKTIAEKVGKSESYVDNLIRLRRNLCPKLWERFAKGGGGCPVQAELIKWSTANPFKTESADAGAASAEFQEKMLAAWEAVKSGGKAPKGSTGARDSSAPKKPGEKKIEAELTRAEAAKVTKDKVDASYAQGVADALGWVLRGGEAPYGEPAKEGKDE